MAVPSQLLAMAGSVPAPGVYQTSSSLESAVFWLVLAIVIIMGAGLILYLFFVRGSYERERQAALAMVSGRRAESAPRDDSYYRSASSYSYRGEVPDAVAAAMTGIRREPEPVLEVEEERAVGPAPSYGYGRGRAPAPRRGAPLPPPRSPGGPVERPLQARTRPAAVRASPLDDLLHGGEGGRLRDEDRELLREEQLEPEPEAPGLYDDEEVTFEDEPEPEPAVHPPAPYGISGGEKPVWESVLEGAGGPGGRGAAPEDGDEVELVDIDEPSDARQVLSRPVAEQLLRDDILKSVRGAAPAKRPAQAGRPPAAGVPPPSRKAGPAWTEGRPVFSRPLEEPETPPAREAQPSRGLQESLGEISHKLHAMDERAVPRLPPKAEAKMGLQEKKFLEALRAVQEKKREEARAQEEEGRRLLESQMQELERRKREDDLKRQAEERRRARERADRELRERAEQSRLEQAGKGVEQRLRTAEEARSDDQRARQEAVSRENERRRREARPRQDKPADVDDVLARIGIK
jgi:hypothetical protein